MDAFCYSELPKSDPFIHYEPGLDIHASESRQVSLTLGGWMFLRVTEYWLHVPHLVV